jgi:hypothetical protein
VQPDVGNFRYFIRTDGVAFAFHAVAVIARIDVGVVTQIVDDQRLGAGVGDISCPDAFVGAF